jgi:hypothetical protein
MTHCVLQIQTRKDGLNMEGLSGMYILDYNPRVDFDMNYTLVVCDQPEEAKIFDSAEEAHKYYLQVCPNHPTLIDGTPNRPLTSWHVQCVPLKIQ